MKILNAMFSKGLGGIEQAFLDYTKALTQAGCDIIQVVNKSSEIKSYLKGKVYLVTNFSKYDPFTIYRLKKIIQHERPDCIITHGNRAARVLQLASKNTPVISLCHNYSYKQLLKSNAIITISDDLNRQLKALGYGDVYTVPNMIEITPDIQFVEPILHTPPVIGSIGRLVKKKGFDIFLNALALLKERNIAFKAVLGGDGEEKLALEKLAKNLGIEDRIEFLGWVTDKVNFYKNIDIFCLPSLHEPFGIVLLEAFKYSKPIISTRSEGPREIIIDQHNGLLIEPNSPEDLAHKIELLLTNLKLATNTAKQGFNTVQTKYSSKAIASQIMSVLNKVLKS